MTFQEGVQKLFLFVALLCVPWMLLAKPIHIMRSQKKQHELVSLFIFKLEFVKNFGTNSL